MTDCDTLYDRVWHTLWHIVTYSLTYCDTLYDILWHTLWHIVTHSMTDCDTLYDRLWHTIWHIWLASETLPPEIDRIGKGARFLVTLYITWWTFTRIDLILSLLKQANRNAAPKPGVVSLHSFEDIAGAVCEENFHLQPIFEPLGFQIFNTPPTTAERFATSVLETLISCYH